jgi:hypothetical protein
MLRPAAAFVRFDDLHGLRRTTASTRVLARSLQAPGVWVWRGPGRAESFGLGPALPAAWYFCYTAGEQCRDRRDGRPRLVQCGDMVRADGGYRSAREGRRRSGLRHAPTRTAAAAGTSTLRGWACGLGSASAHGDASCRTGAASSRSWRERVDRRVVEGHPAVAGATAINGEVRPGPRPGGRTVLLSEARASMVLMGTSSGRWLGGPDRAGGASQDGGVTGSVRRHDDVLDLGHVAPGGGGCLIR